MPADNPIVVTLMQTVGGYELTTNFDQVNSTIGSLKVKVRATASLAAVFVNNPNSYYHFFKIWNADQRIKIGFMNALRHGPEIDITKQIPKKDKVHWMDHGYQTIGLKCTAPATVSNQLPAIGEKLSILTAGSENGSVRIQTVPFYVDFFSAETVNNFSNSLVGTHVPLTFNSVTNLGLAKYNLSPSSIKGAPVIREKSEMINGKQQSQIEIVGYVKSAAQDNKLASLSVYSIQDKEFAQILKKNSPAFSDLTPLEDLPSEARGFSARLVQLLVCGIKAGKMQAADLPRALTFVNAVAGRVTNTIEYCRNAPTETMIDLSKRLLDPDFAASGIAGFREVEFRESPNGIYFSGKYLEVLDQFWGCNSRN